MPEIYQFDCPNCGSHLKVKQSAVGKRVICGKCEQKVPVLVPESTKKAENPKSKGFPVGWVGLRLVILSIAVYLTGAQITGRHDPFIFVALVAFVTIIAGMILSAWGTVKGDSTLSGSFGFLGGLTFLIWRMIVESR